MTELRKLNEGREAEIFEWRDGKVLRLLRDQDRGAQLAVEVAAMRAATASGVPVPAVGEIVTIDGRPGLVLERIDGPDLLTLMARKPWRAPSLARELGRLHARLHAVDAPPELPNLRDRIRGRIADSGVLPHRLARGALALLDELPDGDAICHGDFHPANLLLSAYGPVIIDWVNATRGDAMADVARTRLMLRVGALAPGSPELIRRLQGIGRARFRALYLRGYRRARSVDGSLVDRWEVVRAADRAGEGIDEELPDLIETVERGVF